MSDAASNREKTREIMQLHGSRGAVLQAPDGALVVVRKEPDRELLASVGLGTGATTVFEANRAYSQVQVVITNVSGADRTYRLHHLTNGETAAADNARFYDKTLTVNSPDFWQGFMLRKGEKIQGLCNSANGVTVAVYGVPK